MSATAAAPQYYTAAYPSAPSVTYGAPVTYAAPTYSAATYAAAPTTAVTYAVPGGATYAAAPTYGTPVSYVGAGESYYQTATYASSYEIAGTAAAAGTAPAGYTVEVDGATQPQLVYSQAPGGEVSFQYASAQPVTYASAQPTYSVQSAYATAQPTQVTYAQPAAVGYVLPQGYSQYQAAPTGYTFPEVGSAATAPAGYTYEVEGGTQPQVVYASAPGGEVAYQSYAQQAPVAYAPAQPTYAAQPAYAAAPSYAQPGAVSYGLPQAYQQYQQAPFSYTAPEGAAPQPVGSFLMPASQYAAFQPAPGASPGVPSVASMVAPMPHLQYGTEPAYGAPGPAPETHAPAAAPPAAPSGAPAAGKVAPSSKTATKKASKKKRGFCC